MNIDKRETSHQDDGEKMVKLSSIICSRTLDYEAPLLSTRRAYITRSNVINPTNWVDSHERVPFSWEQSPGKPKQKGLYYADLIVPPPKLPPARWHDQMILDQNLQYNCDFASASASEDDDVDAFSDAIDVFSLGESTRVGDIDHDIDDDDDEQRGIVNDWAGSPNFILKRFLLDANALAISSSLALQGSRNSGFGREQIVHEPKGCGIDFLFPWKAMKLKHCSLKSPVRDGVNAINMNSSSRQWRLGKRIKK